MLLNPFNNFYRVPFVSLVMSREQCVPLWARNLERLAHRGEGCIFLQRYALLKIQQYVGGYVVNLFRRMLTREKPSPEENTWYVDVQPRIRARITELEHVRKRTESRKSMFPWPVSRLSE